jgi:BMFP domain-containing protein YqiC
LDRVEGVLLETRQDVRETNAKLGKLETEVRAGFADLRAEIHEGFADVGQKLDSAADRDRHLEDRVQQLGDRVARLEARNPEPR